MKIKLNREQIDCLLEMNLPYAVIVNADVSVRIIGAVDSAHNNFIDARAVVMKLNVAYNLPNAFLAIDLRTATAGEA